MSQFIVVDLNKDKENLLNGYGEDREILTWVMTC